MGCEQLLQNCEFHAEFPETALFPGNLEGVKSIQNYEKSFYGDPFFRNFHADGNCCMHDFLEGLEYPEYVMHLFT